MLDNESLMAHIFKSRYFPWSNISRARTGYTPSYAWRSLLHARDLVENGAQWVVGNGRSIQIFKDNWVIGLHPTKLHWPAGELDHDAVVEELMDPVSRAWDRTKIHQSFNNFVAKKILSVPISFRLPEDRQIWHWKKSGQYTVRS